MNRCDWSLLQSFTTVAKFGSLSAGAQAQGVSQPTMTRHISQLEEDLGYRLFERGRTGIQLTAAGAELLKHANMMAEAAARFQASSEGRHEAISGTVRITASRIVSTFILPDILTKLRTEEPGIQIELIASDETQNLLYRDADIAVRMFRPEQPDVITRKIADLELGAYATAGYFERKGIPQRLEDILDHDVIGYDRSSLIIDGFKRLGISVDRDFFVFRSDDQVVCWNMVVAGYGIGFNQIVIGTREPKVKRIDLAGKVAMMPVWLTAHSALKTNPRIRRVYDFLAEEIQNLG
ncbi:MAG: LysR family transcriptional regulator [Pseudomonadota bacterium]